MRAEERARLSEPYPAEDNPEARLAEALGVHVPGVMELYRRILADLDDDKFGIGWWAPYPGTSRRILISDHLLLCVLTIQTNLIEARLHLYELLDVWQQTSNFFSDTIKVRGRQIVFDPPPRVSPNDDLPLRLSALHAGGFFRAVIGALDCFGAAMVGVAALRTSILRADFQRATNSFPAGPTGVGETLQADLRTHLEEAIRRNGPRGWLTWATDFRNMLVHRGRRADISQFVPREGQIVDARGRPIVKAETVQQLPRDPGRSEVEVLLRPARALVLTETARDTLEGVLASMLGFLKEGAEHLLDIWQKRRQNPSLLLQPHEQWPEGPSTETTGFEGYRPGSMPYDPGALIASPTLRSRLTAAALDDTRRGAWARFD